MVEGRIMNLKELAENLGLDEDEYIEMLKLFFESGGSDLEKLEAAINEGDAEKAHGASHSLKGSSGSLGLEKLFELAKSIDDKDRQGILDGLDEMVKELRREYELFLSTVEKYTAE
jgi:HPt (histidine-containing phosphotransfer) domain-containing protein